MKSRSSLSDALPVARMVGLGISMTMKDLSRLSKLISTPGATLTEYFAPSKFAGIDILPCPLRTR